MKSSNNRMHTNRRPAFQCGCAGFFGRWIRCQHSVPAAVGELTRSTLNSADMPAFPGSPGACGS
jgi:hypothetical protein